MTVTPAHPGFHSAQTKMSLAHYNGISLVRLEAKSLSTSIGTQLICIWRLPHQFSPSKRFPGVRDGLAPPDAGATRLCTKSLASRDSPLTHSLVSTAENQ